jgi:hypothetical protein
VKDTAEHTAQAAAEEQEMSWNGRKEGHMHALPPPGDTLRSRQRCAWQGKGPIVVICCSGL